MPLRLTPLLLVLAACAHAPTPRPEPLGAAEAQRILDAALTRLARGGPNHQHVRRLYAYAPAYAEAEQADLGVVRAAALLHDATKEDGQGEPKERFCSHAEQAGAWSVGVLLGLGRSPTFARRVAEAINEHMGPGGQNEAWGDTRFMSKFCQRPFPAPSTPEARVLYDVDMLDLMTVDGVVKVVELRQKNAEFAREPLKDSAIAGKDSAWKSVHDAHQTLLTPLAQRCGALLVGHTKGFLDSVDWAATPDVATFKAASVVYLARAPLPACLPAVPPGEDLP